MKTSRNQALHRAPRPLGKQFPGARTYSPQRNSLTTRLEGSSARERIDPLRTWKSALGPTSLRAPERSGPSLERGDLSPLYLRRLVAIVLRTTPVQQTDRAGFARSDLGVVLGTLFLLTVLVLPMLAGQQTRSLRLVCANHLRQVGIGFLSWAHDQEGRVPFDVPAAEGGTRGHPLAPNAWLQFSWISNHVSSPRVFHCPSDTGRPASDFSLNPAGGYLHPNYGNSATSYFLAHGNVVGVPIAQTPRSFLAGDRNAASFASTSCERFGSALAAWFPASWRETMHNREGNLLLFDGSVLQVDGAGFDQAARAPANVSIDSLVQFHFMVPR